MPWCPKCRYEYVEGIKTCRDCGSKLVSKSVIDEMDRQKAAAWERLKKSKPNWEVVYVGKDKMDAEIVKGYLQSQDIPAITIVEGKDLPLPNAYIGAYITPLEVLVPKEHLTKAKQVLLTAKIYQK